MELDIYQVDAFTTEIFKGNPAGVCITDAPISEEAMRSIAKEMAVSETAFLTRSTMNLRWFTPEVEVKLCGHGTLSVVHILLEKGELSRGDTVTFDTLSGPLDAYVGESNIELTFPNPCLQYVVAADKKLIQDLGLKSDQVISTAHFDSKVVIEVSSEKVLLDLKPNFDALKSRDGRGVVVTSLSESGDLDFVSRYFAPWVGVNEDPVTGSAHCALNVHWSKKLNKAHLKAFQASERGGYVEVETVTENRTKLKGQAVTVIKGTMSIPN